MTRFVLLAALLAIVATACGSEPGSGIADEATPSPTAAVAAPVSSLDRVGDPSQADVPAVVTGSNEFGFDLYRRLASATDDNIVLSPVSVALAFAQVQAGATGTTEQQLADVFGYPPGPQLHPAMNALDQALEAANREPASEEDGQIVLDVANSVWGQEGLTFGQDFVDALAANYGAGLRTVDFAGDPHGAVDAVNSWVNEKTRGRIAAPVDGFPPATILAIVNAVYLKASWDFPFSESQTTDAAFTRPDGTVVEVPTMAGQRSVQHAQRDGVDAIRLPYVGDELSMLLLLPADESGRPALEQMVDAAFIRGLVDDLETVEAEMTLPRWDLETRIDLLSQLAALGADDLTHLESLAPGAFVGDAFQVANITVNEEGTEAAAATIVAVVTSGPPRAELEIRFDRPFLFLIRHDPTGTVLFLGRVTDPAPAG